MVIESVMMASTILSQINGLRQKANETGEGTQQLMGTISDFGEAVTEFEVKRKSSTFNPLSQSELLKLTMIKKSYERHWKDVHDLLAMVDPEMLKSFQQARAEQEHARKQQMAMLSRKRKERDHLIQQILVGFTTLIIGSILIAVALFFLLP